LDEQPLKGITVVELCHSVSGPFAGLILAELGANVIKVENPGQGDHARGWGPPYWNGTSSAYQSLNRDKQGVAIDLKAPAAAEQLRRFIIERADVVVQNMRPGSLDGSPFSAENLLADKPLLVYCNLGAYGDQGPLALHPGYDPLMQAFGGIMSITGEAGGGPVRVGPAVVDMGSGMWAVIGILAALHRRTETGKGCIVGTSLFETAVAWLTIQIAGYLANGEIRRPMGSGIAEIVPHQAFRTKDGYLMVAAGNDGLFVKLAEAIGEPGISSDSRFATNDARVRNRETLIPFLASAFAARPAADWAATLDRYGVPNAPIQNIDQVVAHPQTHALGMVQTAPDCDMALVGLPLSFNGKRPPYRKSAPSLGESNEQVLGPLGVQPAAE
jgi:crotonobetainyl-CoA:carnitine CoA-transferase CaiB-like acyl-CoA transferase